MTNTLREGVFKIMIISHSIPPRLRNVSDKNCGVNRNKYFMSITFIPSNRAVYDQMWKNMVKPDKPQMAI